MVQPCFVSCDNSLLEIIYITCSILSQESRWFLSSAVSSLGIQHAETLLISKYSVRIVKTVPLLISNMDKGMHINVFINWLHASNQINIMYYSLLIEDDSLYQVLISTIQDIVNGHWSLHENYSVTTICVSNKLHNFMLEICKCIP